MQSVYGRYLEQEPLLNIQVQAAEAQYNSFANSYYSRIDQVVSVVAAEMMHHVAVPGSSRDTRDALVWRIDGNILDDRFDHAVRLAARFVAASNTETESIANKVYLPEKSWNQKARNLGEYGLRLVCVAYQTFDLEQTGSLASGTHFSHHLPGGAVYYKPGAEIGPTLRLGALPLFESIVTHTFAAHMVDHAQSIISDEDKTAFAAATKTDQSAPVLRGDNLEAFRRRTAGIADASGHIKELAKALYMAEGDMLSPALLYELIVKDVATVAQWALLNKGAYHTETISWPQREPLTSRLQWARDLGYDFSEALKARMRNDASGFAQKLQQEMSVIGAFLQSAVAIQETMQPPATIALERPYWSVRLK